MQMPKLFVARPFIAWLCLATATSVWAAPTSETGLGTLLYSPAQRDAMVRERSGQVGMLQEIAQRRLDGVVRREGGKGTVWVNGDALRQGDPTTPKIVGVDAVVKERRLRVGQSVDAITGEASDLVPPGSVRATGPRSGR
ncbi:MAG: hypothetical protein H7Y28_03195 [Rhodoferax sp.]|nr:hypothetical protein [Rhodoferax sp.]